MKPIACALLAMSMTGQAWAELPGSSRLDQVLATKQLRVCMAGDYLPFAKVDAQGRWEGIDVDLAGDLAQSLGVSAVFIKSAWAGLTDDFIGQCDVAMGGISVTLSRMQRVAFSEPHLDDGKVPIIRCADQARFPDFAAIDQPGTRAIVNPGGTNERFARGHYRHAKLTVHGDNLSVFGELLDGRADVMVTDASEVRWQARLHPELCQVALQAPLLPVRKAFMLPRGDVPFKAYVDTWMSQLQDSGEYRRIEDRWLVR